jgi:hypothetical protein
MDPRGFFTPSTCSFFINAGAAPFGIIPDFPRSNQVADVPPGTDISV